MSKELSIENLEDYAFYESGLSADGCLEKLDDYTRKAIKRYGEILLEKQKEMLFQTELHTKIKTLEKLLEQRI